MWVHFLHQHVLDTVVIFEEDIRHGLPPMPGGADPVGGGVWVTDEGKGTHLLGDSERTVTVQ